MNVTPFHMFTDEEACHVSRLVPFRLARHVIVNHFSVDPEILEADVLHFPFFVVAGNDGQFGVLSVVGDVLEEHVLNPCPEPHNISC